MKLMDAPDNENRQYDGCDGERRPHKDGVPTHMEELDYAFHTSPAV